MCCVSIIDGKFCAFCCPTYVGGWMNINSTVFGAFIAVNLNKFFGKSSIFSFPFKI